RHNLYKEAKKETTNEIKTVYCKKYSKKRNYSSKSKGAQEAHEAIRPTDFSKHTISGDYDQQRLYELIWKRGIASQMSDAKLERTNVRISADKQDKLFSAKGEIITID